MNGREFVRRARRYARANGLEWRFDPARGKGSHGTFYLGVRETVVQHGEIGPGLLLDMLRQLNIDRRRFRTMKYTFPCNIVPDDSEGGWGFVVAFPDIPPAHTGGKTFKESIILAEDCMVVALSIYVDKGMELPTPGPYQKGQELLTVQPVIAAQLDLYTAMREQGVSRAELAERLGVSGDDADRLLSLDYCTPIAQVVKALRTLGCELAAAEQVA